YGEKCLEVVQKISAVPLPAEAAMYLDAQVGSPSLRILRHYMGIKRNILEISESYHPGDRYALTMNMRANR
ncbi:UTRA domain-containing protein, partial [Parasutterella sp.]